MIKASINSEKARKRIGSILKVVKWKTLFGKNFICGNGCVFYPSTKITLDYTNESIGHIKIGNNCFFNNNCSLTSMCSIEIGDNCIIGENVSFYDHDHRHDIDNKPFKKQGYKYQPIKIGNNVWIGSGSIILRGTVIEDNVVIGAGNIVRGNIESGTVLVRK